MQLAVGESPSDERKIFAPSSWYPPPPVKKGSLVMLSDLLAEESFPEELLVADVVEGSDNDRSEASLATDHET